MEAAESLKHVKQKKEMGQRCKKEDVAKRILASANGNTQQAFDIDEKDDGKTPHGPKRQRIRASLNDVENGLEAFGSSVEKSEAARLDFEQRRLDFEELVHKDMLQQRAI